MGSYIEYSSAARLYSEKYNQQEQRKKWNNTYHFFSAGEKNDALQLSKKKAGITGSEQSQDKMNKIGKWLVRELSKCETGQQADSISALPMRRQYEAIIEKKTPVWCGTYGNMFLFFCKANDIETRMIEFFNPGDHHVVNECFIPGQNKWVATDLTYNYLLFKDDAGNVLNTIDVISAVRSNKILTIYQAVGDSIVSKTISGDSISWKQYLQPVPDIYFYKETNTAKIYSKSEKLKRYITPVSFYEVYSENRKSNFWFYIRLFFLWIALPLFVYLFYRLVKRK